MKRDTVPETQWGEFVADLARRHAGQRVDIQVLTPDYGPQLLAGGLPLQGISFDTVGSRSASLEISAGETGDTYVTHVIERPLTLRLAVDRAEQDLALEIEPAEGPKTLVLFRGQAGPAA